MATPQNAVSADPISSSGDPTEESSQDYLCITDEGLLRDEGSYYGRIGASINEKLEAIRAFYTLEKARIKPYWDQIEQERLRENERIEGLRAWAEGRFTLEDNYHRARKRYQAVRALAFAGILACGTIATVLVGLFLIGEPLMPFRVRLLPWGWVWVILGISGLPTLALYLSRHPNDILRWPARRLLWGSATGVMAGTFLIYTRWADELGRVSGFKTIEELSLHSPGLIAFAGACLLMGYGWLMGLPVWVDMFNTWRANRRARQERLVALKSLERKALGIGNLDPTAETAAPRRRLWRRRPEVPVDNPLTVIADIPLKLDASPGVPLAHYPTIEQLEAECVYRLEIFRAEYSLAHRLAQRRGQEPSTVLS